jgi:hypothetical protein
MASSRAQQAAIAISMKKAGKKPKSVPKAQTGKVVKPTADSTKYYQQKAEYLTNRGSKQASVKDWDGMNRDFDNARKAIDAQIRQSKKGLPGYDKNGFPIKSTSPTKTSVVKAGTKAVMSGVNAALKAAKNTKMAKGGSTPAWQRKEGKNPEGGLNAKGVASYRRANPGSKLKTAVTTKPSKLDPDSKSAKRRKSFCSRMSGMKKKLTSAKTANDPNSRINKSLRKWNC